MVAQIMMNKIDLLKYTPKNLLRLHASIINELIRRKIVRTRNNPIGDYTEWLVSKTLGLKLIKSSASGYDAINKNGTRFQIKGRQVMTDKANRQLSAIRELDAKNFDYLIAVIFDAEYNIIEAVKVPNKIIKKYAYYQKHVNAHILYVRDDLLNDPQVKTVKALKPKK